VLQDAVALIGRQEAGAVVARQAVGGLGQVVGTEAEELGGLAICPALSAARGSSIMVPT